MQYVSNFEFFGLMKKLVRDMQNEFEIRKLSGQEFDDKYNIFIKKLDGKCAAHSKDSLLGKSEFVLQYMNEVRLTSSFPQKDRFEKVLDITDMYIKRSV